MDYDLVFIAPFSYLLIGKRIFDPDQIASIIGQGDGLFVREPHYTPVPTPEPGPAERLQLHTDSQGRFTMDMSQLVAAAVFLSGGPSLNDLTMSDLTSP